MSVSLKAVPAFAGRPGARFGGEVSTTALAGVLRWYDRYRQRRILAELDDRMLRDIGLNRTDVARECRKPLWR